MKLIVIIGLILVATVCTANVFDKSWCGNSRVDVELRTGKNNEIKTTATIVVPQNLQEVKSIYNKEETLINKIEQGLILTLDSKANAAHLGTIYNYDEDDNTNIFIPYLYLTSANRNQENIDVEMGRTFKGNIETRFSIVPINDNFGTPLCECQREMLLERIQQNIVRRNSVLTYISQQIVLTINHITTENFNIKKWKNAKYDETYLKSLNKQVQNKMEECKTYVKKIKKLNEEIDNETKNLTVKQNEQKKNQAEINTLKEDIEDDKILAGNSSATRTVDIVGTKQNRENFPKYIRLVTMKMNTACKWNDRLINSFDKDARSKDGTFKKLSKKLSNLSDQVEKVGKIATKEFSKKSDEITSQIKSTKGQFEVILDTQR